MHGRLLPPPGHLLSQGRPAIMASTSSSSSSSPSHKRARLGQDAAAPNPTPAMPLNRMHPDNRYRHYTPDFAALAKQYPDSFGP